jgi:hypothetical protein
MANQFVTALRQEINSLEKDLEGDPRFKKFKRLMAALDAYLDEDEDDEAETAKSPPVSPKVEDAAPRQSPGRTASEKNEIILKHATDIINSRGNTPIKTRDILAGLQLHGVEVHGKNPRNTLSAVLSYSERFKAHGKSGWTVKGENDADENTEAADDPNLGGRMSTASAEHRPTSGGTQRGPVHPRPGGGT